MNSSSQSHLGQNQLALGMSYPELALLTNLGQHLFSSARGNQGYAHSQEHQYKAEEDMDERPFNGRGGRTRSGGDSRSSSAYASRHQAAEQRRRTRINERLDLLRKLVPHAERANTACFLEEVIKYIEHLKAHNTNLQRMVEDIKTGSNHLQGAAAMAAAAAAPAGAGLQQQHVSMPALASVSLPVLPLSLPGRSDAAGQLQHLQDTDVPPGAGQPLQQMHEAPDHADPGPLPASLSHAAVSEPAAAVLAPPALASAGALAAEPAAAPSASQALMGLQGLLPGVDVQALLQQALLNAQAQLLQQAQQHQAATATAAAAAAGGGGGAASSTSTAQAAAAGLATTTSPEVPPAPAAPQQHHPSHMMAMELQQQPVSQPGLLAPAGLAPPATLHQPQQQPHQQRSLLSVLKAPGCSDFVRQGQQQQQQAGASKPSDEGFIPGSTLPAELRKLKAQLEGNSCPIRPQEVSTTAGPSVFGTSSSSHFALIPPNAGLGPPKEAQLKDPYLAGQQQAAANLPPLAGAGPSLQLQRGATGGGSSTDMGDFAGLSDEAGLGQGVHLLASAAVKAAAAAAAAAAGGDGGCADDGSVAGDAEGPGSKSPPAGEQEDTETTVPHKKRKMLML